MRDLTAAQNIFIGREPRAAGGWLLDETALNAGLRGDLSLACTSRSTRAPRSAR
ncbi:MAG: hypothetical protein V9G20_29745 [Candidatus Promineifilaceae bacterium]